MCRFSLFLFVLLAQFPECSYAAAIHDAAKKGDLPALVEALDSGVTVDEDGPSGTALYIAARRGHLAEVNVQSNEGKTPIHLAGSLKDKAKSLAISWPTGSRCRYQANFPATWTS